MGSTRVPSWVWAVLVLAHGLAMAWALHSGHWNFPDSGRYRVAAYNLEQHGQLYARPWGDAVPQKQAMQEFTIRPPGYPAVLAALGGAEGSPWLVLLVQNGLSVLGLGSVLGWWAGRARPLFKHWLAALVLVLTFPAQLIYTNAVMSEAFLQSLLLLLLATIVRFYRTGNICWCLGAAAVATLAFLFKPVCGPLAVCVGVMGAVLAWRWRRPLVLAAGLLPVLLLGVYMAWNQQRTGYFHLSSIAEINLLHYNAAGVMRQAEGPAAEEAWVAQVLREANAQPEFAARQRLIQQRAKSVLFAYPRVYIQQHLLGVGAFFLDPGRFDVSEFLGVPPTPGGGLLAQVRAGGLWRAIGQLPLGLMGGLLLVLLTNVVRLGLAVRGFGRLGNGSSSEQAVRWGAVALLAYLALLTGPLGAARFLMPAWPLLLGAALLGLRGPVRVTAVPETNDAIV